MPIVRIRVSSASGDEIPEGSGARIRVMWNDQSRADMRADLTDEEVAKLLPWVEPVVERPERRARVDTKQRNL